MIKMIKIGIYRILSPSGSVYIGQTWNYDQRIKHYKNKNCKTQPIVYNSLNKYGYENHVVEMIHELPKDVDQNILNEYEKLYILTYRNAKIRMMNIREGGEGGGKLSENTKLKISISRKKQKLIISEKNKNRLSILHTGNNYNLGKKQSEESKNKKREFMNKSKHKFISKKVLCLNNNTIYESQRNAAKNLNINYKHISCVCNNKRHHVNGYKFIFV